MLTLTRRRVLPLYRKLRYATQYALPRAVSNGLARPHFIAKVATAGTGVRRCADTADLTK